jgi:hypothetical protein
MQFQLPSNLQTELLAYDPKLKALAREQKQTKSNKKAKYPLGNIPHVIPYEIVRESMQQTAIDQINTCLAADRHYSFTKLVDVATPQARTVTKAILYHFEQCWYAAWLPPAGKEDEYVYGYSYIFRNTESALKVIPRKIANNKETFELIEVGRSTFCYCRKLVTRQDIANGDTHSHWRAEYMGSYTQKGRDIARAVEEFRKALQETLPVWEDSRSLFDRIKCNSIAKALEIPVSLVPEDQQVDWKLTVDNLLDLPIGNQMLYSEWRNVKDLKHILNTPFFRKWIQQKFDEAIATYNDPTNKTQRKVKAPFRQVMKLVETIKYIEEIWPNCPIDHYQNYITELLSVRVRMYTCNEQVKDWLKTHMPVASFFGIIAKFYAQEQELNQHYRVDPDFGIPMHYFSDWMDTLNMLTRVLEKQDMAPPKRWRINEFHDYVQAESWKIVNPNEKLPQDLFPEPIKVRIANEHWSFFQPNDTHQLAMWGQAVRNCVGSASSYASGVRKKQHFIVLCMVEGKPRFTIQLRVDGGVMSVDQIKGLSNQSLTTHQRDEYTEAFRQALQLRDKQLSS